MNDVLIGTKWTIYLTVLAVPIGLIAGYLSNWLVGYFAATFWLVTVYMLIRPWNANPN